MIEIRQTEVFTAWLTGLRDRLRRDCASPRIDRLSLGDPGDVKPVGKGVSEMRIDYGPGYWLYFTQRGTAVVLLLCGGDKRTQAEDIALAVKLAQEM